MIDALRNGQPHVFRYTEDAEVWLEALAATSRKLGVNFLQYLHDRIVGGNRVPALALLIDERADERAKELALGASWMPA